MPIIKLKTEINAPKNIVFDLSRSIDLHKLSTFKSNEQAIAGITSGLIGLGESVTWKAKHFGFYQTLTSRITEFKAPSYFVDEMEKGIFKKFRHEHIFEGNDDSTTMIDVLEYVSPLGFLGILADRLFLEKYLEEFLKTRNKVIKDYAESEKWKDVFGE